MNKNYKIIISFPHNEKTSSFINIISCVAQNIGIDVNVSLNTDFTNNTDYCEDTECIPSERNNLAEIPLPKSTYPNDTQFVSPHSLVLPYCNYDTACCKDDTPSIKDIEYNVDTGYKLLKTPSLQSALSNDRGIQLSDENAKDIPLSDKNSEDISLADINIKDIPPVDANSKNILYEGRNSESPDLADVNLKDIPLLADIILSDGNLENIPLPDMNIKDCACKISTKPIHKSVTPFGSYSWTKLTTGNLVLNLINAYIATGNEAIFNNIVRKLGDMVSFLKWTNAEGEHRTLFLNKVTLSALKCISFNNTNICKTAEYLQDIGADAVHNLEYWKFNTYN